VSGRIHLGAGLHDIAHGNRFDLVGAKLCTRDRGTDRHRAESYQFLLGTFPDMWRAQSTHFPFGGTITVKSGVSVPATGALALS
jgi:hypothetical protein